MNFSLFIAKRIRSQKGSSFSKVITRIAIGSIALGIAALIISMAIFEGFKQTILDKIVSQTGHIQILKFDMNNSFETSPLSTQREFYEQLKNQDYISHIQPYTQKPVLLRTDEDLMGLVLKGVDNQYDTVSFKKNLIEGRFIHFDTSNYSKEIVISQSIKDKLRLKIGDDLLAFFLQDPPRQRKLEVVGIYQTGIEDFDERLVYCDQGLLQRLNSWGDTLVGGYEVFFNDYDDFNNIDAIYDEMESNSDYDMYLQKVTNTFAHFFEWFSMVNKNVTIFLSVILFVALFNVISVLLILITERVTMIGMLKALGATSSQILKIFFQNGLVILWKGILIGNVIGVLFCLAQDTFKFIPLDIETYYMSSVPISWNIPLILMLNFGIITLVLFILWIPSIFISRIKPIRAIRFD
ncbi:ABC-type transport system, involved in lipoprotein release, permease component [Bernardetia litoralis DSM 6794]|uniref:ABC-type transport system, involved in lipoprotein release, permease component n=1 Tax=Bernardetia litoralis (strain ATCC 23117 / DSM 6794 / NBRC 15988 / NCIMB 1366 / Fx l1 / Sio-4) TaxID=880071 RepID=I4AQ99_BERLS|nr:ABC transporter permease [Bernardetia litoralis]AFM06134.1 ABC-type transport system, involved in lipoprotein release, permease component [Bernardetia litoralis DSM 6794]